MRGFAGYLYHRNLEDDVGDDWDGAGSGRRWNERRSRMSQLRIDALSIGLLISRLYLFDSHSLFRFY